MDQNKISKRQLTRMIYIEGFGASGLTLPAAAAWQSTSEGLIPMICYGALLILFTAYFFFLAEKYGKDFTMKKWVGAIYVFRYLLHGMILFYFFGLFIQTVYMPDVGIFQILLPFSILLWYCTGTTLQKRARFLELMFPWIVTLFFLLLFFATLGLWGKVEAIPWTEDVYKMWENGYLLLLCTTPLEFLFFLVPAVTGNLWEQTATDALEENIDVTKGEEESNFTELKKCVWKAVLGVYLWNLLLWFFTVETLGGTLTANSLWPVIKMLQLIRMPGGFLERLDILLAIFWLLCLIGVLSGYVFYGKKIAEDTLEISGRTGWIAFLFLLMATFVFSADSERWLEWFLFYKKWIDFPLLLILPLFARNSANWNKRNAKKRRKIIKQVVGIFAVMMTAFSLSGCKSQDDVEEKSYVLSLYVDDCGANYEYWVARADLSAMEEKEQSIPCTVVRVEGESMEGLETEYRKTEVGEMEWNHIYTIFLGPNLVKNEEKLEQFLREWEASWQKSPNVLLSVCMQEANDLYELKTLPTGSAGQEVSRLAEQAEAKKEQENPILCRTPIEVLKAKEKGQKQIALYQTKIRQGQIVLVNWGTSGVGTGEHHRLRIADKFTSSDPDVPAPDICCSQVPTPIFDV